MKKYVFIILTLTLVILCYLIHDSRRSQYIKRHKANYDSGNIISRDNNPFMPGTADVYDAEDFRAGAVDVCNVIRNTYGRDLCLDANYWGIGGPRI